MNRDDLFDLAVVGAGPAGSTAAALAAGAGLSVLLLEQKRLPREKACGGLVSARALALLPPGFTPPPGASLPFDTLRVAARGSIHCHTGAGPLGLLTERAPFDLALAEHARTRGARLREGCSLTGLETISLNPPVYRLAWGGRGGSGTALARHVIAADGAYSACARLAGLRAAPPPRRLQCGWGFAACRPREGTREGEEPEVTFYPLPFLGGLGWSFAGPRAVNYGVAGWGPRKALRKVMDRLFPGWAAAMAPVLWPLPYAGPLMAPARENILLAGDAAGLVEPVSGEGLHRALSSARLAVEAVCAAEAAGGHSGTIYTRLFDAAYRRPFARSLGRAFCFHARGVLAPGTLPGLIAALMAAGAAGSGEGGNLSPGRLPRAFPPGAKGWGA